VPELKKSFRSIIGNRRQSQDIDKRQSTVWFNKKTQAKFMIHKENSELSQEIYKSKRSVSELNEKENYKELIKKSKQLRKIINE
jgi:glycyl-tRNA synthetase beta subunit